MAWLFHVCCACTDCYLPAESQLTGDVERFEAPVSTTTVKHDVVVIFLRSLHVEFLLEALWAQLQRLLQGVH